MAYDSARGQTVMFGGGDPNTNTNFGDTWVWDGVNWIQKFPATSPPPTSSPAIAYDAAHQQVVMFGGAAGGSIVATTWVWDGTNWTQKFPANSPSPRLHAAMAFDAARHQVVLFGGGPGSPTAFADTWVWNGNNWTQEFPPASPPARSGHRMAYDSARAQVVLFGGTVDAVTTFFSDTWVWDGTTWIQKFPATSPTTPRFHHTFAYDAIQQVAVLFGGQGPNNTPLYDDTWTWDGTTWTQQTAATKPTGRSLPCMVYDLARTQFVLFGGFSGTSFVNDTWVLLVGAPANGGTAFAFQGQLQAWVVPPGVTSVSVDARGAQGGGNPSAATPEGGKGGRVQTTLAVTPGETLTVYVGGRGGDLTGPNTAGPGGFNGGGTGGIDNVDFNGPAGGGGGASDVRQGGNDVAHRVVVAGGGGGAECCTLDSGGLGGAGGGLTGMPGGSKPFTAAPGGGGTQFSGGAGGGGCNGSGTPGSFGQGGVGGNGNRSGGGGGGGYYGGGGGGGCLYGAGGGGGSSYSADANAIHTQGYQIGDGQIIITPTGAPLLFGPPPQPVPSSVTLLANPSSVPETPNSMATVIASVLDQFGHPVNGTTVTFSTTAGVLSSSSTQTDGSGQAAVTLTSSFSSTVPVNGTVTATVGLIQGSVTITFVPTNYVSTNWATSSAFNVRKVPIDLSQLLSTSVRARNQCIQVLPLLCKGAQIALGNLSLQANLYFISPSTALLVNQTQFSQALSQYFGITPCAQSGQANCVPIGYNPAAVVILELPFVQTTNVLLNGNQQAPLTLPLGNSGLLSNSILQSTPTGFIDLAFTFSQNSLKNQTLIQDLVQALGSDLAAFAKTSTKGITDALQNQLKVILDLGDVTVNVVTQDLNESGPLASYTILDLYGLQNVVFQVTGGAEKVLDIATFAAQAGALGLTGNPLVVKPAFQLVLTGIDLGVELLPVGLPGLQNNQLFSWFETGLNFVTTVVDPPAVTLMPSIFDSSGSLVLGYNSTDGSVAYASPRGILFQAGDEYVALLDEDPANPSNYSEVVTALGDNVPIPYDVQVRSYNQNQIEQRYSGMLFGGNAVMVPAAVDTASGALIRQPHLSPNLSVQESAAGLTFTVTSLLDDGSPAPAAQAFLTVNSQQYPMVQQDSSTFAVSVAANIPTPTIATTYVIVPSVPGGFAAATLVPQIGLSTTSLAFSSQSVGTASSVQSVSIGNFGTSSMAIVGFSISGTVGSDFAIASGTTCPLTGGSVGIGVSCVLNLTFTPTAVGTRQAILTIRDNAPGTPHIVSLVGTGTPGTPTVNWSIPASITYGTALSGTQLNATASVPGTFAYNPPSGAVLSAGSQALSVTFTPTDATDYTSATATVVVQVNRTSMTITASNATKAFNTPNPLLTWSASGFVNGEGKGVLNTVPVCTTTATTTSPVGSYPITCAGASAANYTFTYVPGTLTVTCHYVILAIAPSNVARGGKVTVTGTVMSCMPASQTISEKFTLTGPLGPSCSRISTVMFTTPQFMLAAGTSKTVSFPFIVPKNACAGTYTTTATTLSGGIVIDGTSATLTVQ